MQQRERLRIIDIEKLENTGMAVPFFGGAEQTDGGAESIGDGNLCADDSTIGCFYGITSDACGRDGTINICSDSVTSDLCREDGTINICNDAITACLQSTALICGDNGTINICDDANTACLQSTAGTVPAYCGSDATIGRDPTADVW